MQHRKVLIVDEEVDFCLLIESYLIQKNCSVNSVQHFYNGIEAIELLRPDIIVLDTNIIDYDQTSLENEINQIENYSPNIFLISARPPRRNKTEQGDLLDEVKKLFDFIRGKTKK